MDHFDFASSSANQTGRRHVCYAGEEVVRGFFKLLETECDSYCILSGYEDLPMHVDSDIDFMVGNADFASLLPLMKSFGDRYGLRLIQILEHEISACSFVLVRLEANQAIYLWLDASSDYRRDGQKRLNASDTLARRRLHPRGFWIPAAADEFDYCLVKKVGKGNLNGKHGTHLSQLCREDLKGCGEALRKRWSPAAMEKILDAATSNDWSSVMASIPALEKELLDSSERESGTVQFMEFARKFRRLIAPSGCWITMLGPDGSGKSSLIEALTDVSRLAFRRIISYHLRPRLLRRGNGDPGGKVTDPHGKPARSLGASLAKLALFWCDYVGGYWLRIRPQMVRSTLVIFDRYYHDLLVDPKRFRSKAPYWITFLVGRLLPVPDLVFILDAPPEVLEARKREVSVEECTRQREAYKKLAEELQRRTRTVVIDTSRPLDECVLQAASEIFGFLEARRIRRYGI